ncbi:MAG: alanine dehydrogenase [Candidatus Thermoplasmatota archaeon]
MRIGLLKETKNGERRVGLTPESVHQLVNAGHVVFVQHDAGEGVGISGEQYQKVGAIVVDTAKEVITESDMIVKVKEPSLIEASLFKENQIIFCYLHLAPNPALTRVLLDKKVIGVAFETITSKNGNPLLCPMSVVAGRMATQIGAHLLQCSKGGRGLLISGVPGIVPPAKVVVLGGGTVGTNAAEIAVGMGAAVIIIDNREESLKRVKSKFGDRVDISFLTNEVLEYELTTADIAIGATHVAGALTTKVVSEELVKKMKRGSVIVDVAIDQGGCFETSRVTTLSEPTFIKHGVIHYCVPNMPGDVPFTSTYALNNFLLPYVLDIANKGIVQACKEDKDVCNGLHVFKGNTTNKYIAATLENGVYVDPISLLCV